MVILVALLFAAAVAAVSVGSTGLRFAEAGRALLGLSVPPEVRDIVSYRTGRVLLAGVVGMSLAAAGAALQALLRNPLADPYILGVSGGGALAAALFITFGGAAFSPFAAAISRAGFSGLAAAAFAGSLAASGIVLWAGRRKGHILPGTLLLVGVMVNAVCGAAVLALTYLSDIAKSQNIVMWLMGNLSTVAVSRGAVLLAGAVAVALAAGLWRLGGRLNLLALGDEEAAHLGVNVSATRFAAFVLAALVTGLSVALAGPIGFVGLVVPHVTRAFVGSDHRLLFPAAAVAGAVFLILADAAARAAALLPQGQELPVGILTAGIGGPFFIWLLRAKRGRYFE
jgi:iron complex transport system permease protein